MCFQICHILWIRILENVVDSGSTHPCCKYFHIFPEEKHIEPTRYFNINHQSHFSLLVWEIKIFMNTFKVFFIFFSILGKISEDKWNKSAPSLPLPKIKLPGLSLIYISGWKKGVRVHRAFTIPEIFGVWGRMPRKRENLPLQAQILCVISDFISMALGFPAELVLSAHFLVGGGPEPAN